MQQLLKRSETLLYWLVIALLMFIPLYQKFPLFNVTGTFVSIRLEDILIAFTFLVWVAVLLLSKRYKQFFDDRLNKLILLFFFVGLVSTFSAVFLTQTAAWQHGMLHYLRRVEFLILLPICITAIKTKRQAYVALGVLTLVIFFVNFYAFGQRYLHFPAISTTNSVLSSGVVYYLQSFDRVNSTFAGHYDLAIFLLMGITVISAVIFYFFPKKLNIKNFSKRQLFYSLWLLLLLGSSMIVLVMTAARLSFVAAIFGVMISLFFVGQKKFILLIGAAALLFMLYPSHLRDRLISTFTVNIKNSWQGYVSTNDIQNQRSQLNIPTLPVTWDNIKTQDGIEIPDISPGEPTDLTELAVYRSFAIRTDIEWPRALAAFKKNPLLGTGYSSIGLATDNDYLRALGETGLLGFLSFGLLIYEIMKRVWKQYRSSNTFVKYLTAGVLSMIISFLINAVFIDVFEASKVASIFWLVLGINFSMEKINNA